MHVNLVRAGFILITAHVGFIGLLINYVEAYLPAFLIRSYRYGKISVNVHQPIVEKIEVPKRWFKHFYVFAAPTLSYILYLIVRKYLWEDDVPKYVLWVLDICLGPSRQPLVSPERTFLAVFLFNLHVWKRLYETHCVSIFSEKRINITHYVIGFSHYMGASVALIGESQGFFEDSGEQFYWRRITYLQLVCAIVFVLSSYAQLETNFILSNLRKNEDGKINSTVYKIPHGSLFEYVSGALQITEIVVYVTLSAILWQSSTFHYVTIWVIVNQICTAMLTHKWYIETFESYPKSRKIVLPYIF
ncbi:Polyprenol reductase [Anthophora plagiata]